MWLFFLVSCIILWGFTSVFYKKGADKDDKYICFKFSIIIGIVFFIIATVFLLIRDEEISILESAVKFWPMTLFGIIYAIGNTFTFNGYIYNEASIESPVENTANGFCFIIMIVLFTIIGKGKSLLDIVSVYELIGIICIFSGITFLGIIQHREAKDKGLKESFKSGATALIFPVLFSLMDGLETIVTGICLDRTHGFAMPTDDSVIIVGMEYAIIAFGFWIYVSVKEKRLFNPVSKKNLPFISGALCDNVAIVLYANAMSINAVATDPILALYPTITMMLSRIFLKERLSVKQYLSIALVLVGSVVIVIGENALF